MIETGKLALGLALACLIAFGAYKARALSRSGMWAAAGLGAVIMGLGGLRWAVLLMGFFISSSLFSRMFRARKASLDEKYAKGHRRDAGQVLANGGIAGLAVLLQFVLPQSAGGASALPWILCAAALAAANADTWATELGALSPETPRLITSFKPVSRGTSGGVTLAGTAAALAGSALIALLAVICWPPEMRQTGQPLAAAFALITFAGLTGSLVDSLLGATLQAIYYCPVCAKQTEKHPAHTCGTNTVLYHGLRWLNNDLVNSLCTLSAALLILFISLA